MVRLLQSGVMDLSSPEVIPTMVVTAVRYRSSCEMHGLFSGLFQKRDNWACSSLHRDLKPTVNTRSHI